jgi:hypothetical protein
VRQSIGYLHRLESDTLKDVISRRTLLLAIAGCMTLMVMGAGCAWYVERHRTSLAMSPDAAESEFQQLRARFAGHPPLVDMNARTVAAYAPSPSAAPVRSFHTVIFDTRGGHRLVHLTAPYGFARLFAHRDGRFRWLGELTFLDDTEFDPEPIQLPIDDIKQRGPGLLVDFRHPGGGQFIAWVE